MLLRRLAWAITATTALTFFSPVLAASDADREDQTNPLSDRTYEFLNLFGDVFERVRADYVEKVDDGELIENAINGMLTALDPHSSYLNEKSFSEMQVQTKGEFGGLGIEVTMENGLVKVVSPIDDTPAYHAGIKAGDYISEIDGKPVMGLTLSEAVEKMRGKVGSTITLMVLREGLKEPWEVSLTRDIITIQSVRSRPEKDIGYLRITSFSEQTFSKMEESIEKLKKDVPGMKGVVLDLRNNPGGLLDQAVSVSDGFLDRGEIVSTRGRQKEDIRRYSATPGDLLEGLPMVVLINSGSASASEIVAGALRDHKRAVIMGSKSFGKGSVQTVIPLPGHGAMRLTTSRYYTPSGISIQAEGITPDIDVPEAKIELLDKDSRRILHEADLVGALENDNKLLQKALEKNKRKLPDMPGDTKDDKKGPAKEVEAGALDATEDFQLARALDLLRGLSVYQQQSKSMEKEDAEKDVSGDKKPNNPAEDTISPPAKP